MENLESEKLYLHEGHDEDFEDDDGMPMDEEHPMWRSERITLNSVGIDIGSSTSHLIFSRLTLRRQGIALSSRFVVVNREILHESPILLTPYIDKTTIDTDRLNDFIHEAYQKAGLTPDDIDTGAVVTSQPVVSLSGKDLAAFYDTGAVVTSGSEPTADTSGNGVTLHTDIRIGHPARGLVDYVTERGIDLLVLGHSGHSSVWGTFLGTGLDQLFEFSDNVTTALATLQM